MRRTWAEAMAAELHGPGGFYRAGRGPGIDFRTAATVAPDLLADALARLFYQVPADHRREVVEVGAGDGSLLAALSHRLPDEVRLTGVEQRPRPPELPERVEWRQDLPESITGLLLAFEWLDTVPVDVVVAGRLVEVDQRGAERPGNRPTQQDVAWLHCWWPAGPRREVGHRRDEAWVDAVSRVDAGLGIAIDYGHLAGTRPDNGTLTGYRGGRRVPPAPDPNTDVTAAVAWDALLDAVTTRCPHVVRSLLLSQETALQALGVTAALPSRSAMNAAALRRANQARLLLDPAGLGSFGWVISAVGIDFLEWPT